MKRVKLSQGKFALVDDEDFARVSQYKWSWCGRYPARSAIGEDGKRRLQLLHLFIMGFPGSKVDHRSGNTLDNRRQNLRLSTVGQNACNSKKRTDNKSGEKGVHWAKREGKWLAFITNDGKRFHLGYFNDFTKAVSARRKAAKELHGEFARIN